ncbi:SCO family protein [Parahaliea mediterranea]|uniref:SCO family protein n=1 Tax=Parahaliea mediterranea TaxID=651086 RepID=A0A939DDV9_9GAMM|nr:SCO family protein [Parahaliea mediterranea]MBN7796433.1 SCO family protein [Parahaliea mediterranea]
MALSPRRRMLLGFAAANLTIAAVAIALLLLRPAPPPHIQGVLLEQPRALPDFELVDQWGERFDNSDLRGEWHLLSYGFTTCPDICPTTLSQLTSVAERLPADQKRELRFVFYSVDHRRDTPAQLASYLAFFDREFIGLTHREGNDDRHLPFERGLGMTYTLSPDPAASDGPPFPDYQVAHGVTLYLINPAGELQAIFKPDNPSSTQPGFDPDTVLRDYLAIRNHLG